MSKSIKVISFLSILIFAHCKSVSESIEIKQQKAVNNIIIRTASDDRQSVITIQFPSEIVLTNNSLISRNFLTINYKYNNIPSNRNLNLGLFTNDNGKLKRVRNNKKKTLPSKENINFIIYSRHFVDSSKTTQQPFKPYIEKMVAENKDTLHVGTVTEFKKKHKELFKKLTKGDSISIQFLDGKKLGERVTVPVEW